MTPLPQHIPAHTVHVRHGANPRRFKYSVDFFLIDPKAPSLVWLFSRNGFNLTSINDVDHGGKRGAGRGVAWAEEQFTEAGLSYERILLLTQAKTLGLGFNPVSFWLAQDADGHLIGVISEVNNTFGDRHSYVCHKNGDAIGKADELSSAKAMHVSPFQEVEGDYSFVFNILEDSLSIGINLSMQDGGVFANLTGPRRKLTSSAIAWMLLRRPFGSVRTIVLIYWQALLLKFRGETYRVRPNPPKREVS